MSEAREESRWDDAMERAFAGRRAPVDDSVLGRLKLKSGPPHPVLLRQISVREELPLVRTGGSEEVPAGKHGRYQVLGEIARGGLGIVLQARDSDLGRDVAMKVLPERDDRREADISRFIEEAQIGGQLQHPGIVPVYELGLLGNDRPYFTMKLIQGRTLSALLSDRADLAEDRRRYLRIFEQVCQTMAYAHSRGVVHRDLKPANVMVGTFGEVQVIDWGCAKVLLHGGVADEQRARRENDVLTVRSGPGGTETMAGSAIGTPAYMAPEQILGDTEAIDERTDVFCLGGILAEILTGQPTYVGDLSGGLAQAITRGDLGETWRRVEESSADDDLKEIAADCLRASRLERPRDAGEVAKRISTYLSSLETRAREAELKAAEEKARAQSERRAKRLAIGLGISVVLAVILGGGSYFHLRAKRQAALTATSREVTSILLMAKNFAESGNWNHAVDTVRRAETRLHTRAVEPGTRQLVDTRLREYQTRAKEEDLLRGIEAVRFREDVDLRRAEESYTEGFQAIGIDFQSASVDEIAAGLRAFSPETVERLVRAIDDWASRHRVEPEVARKLIESANEVDPDPWRQKLRLAMLNHDRDLLTSLAASLTRTPRPPESILLLAHALTGPPEQDDGTAALEVLKRGARMHPGDFWLHFRTAMTGLRHPVGNAELSLLHARIAQALRPDNPQVRAVLGLTILARPESWEGGAEAIEAIAEARSQFEWTLERSPGDPMARIGLAGCLAREGRSREAFEAVAELLKENKAPPHAREFIHRFLRR